MIILRPFLVTQATTVHAVAKKLVAATQLVRSFEISPHAGNTSPIYVGIVGANNQPRLVTAANPWIVRPAGAGPDVRDFVVYDLADLYVLAGTDGDGVDVIGYA